MDMKSAVAIALLILVIGLTAYAKRGKLSGNELVHHGRQLVQELMNAPVSEKPSPKFSISCNGTCTLSGSGTASGVSRFYLPESTRIGKNAEARGWISLNLSSASFHLGNGIHVNGKASWIELKNGRVEKELSVSFDAPEFEIEGYGTISMNCTSGRLTAGELMLSPDSSTIKGFSGSIRYNGTAELSGKAEKVSALKSGIEYDVS